MAESNEIRALILTVAETYDVVQRSAENSDTLDEFDYRLEQEFEAIESVRKLKDSLNNKTPGEN